MPLWLNFNVFWKISFWKLIGGIKIILNPVLPEYTRKGRTQKCNLPTKWKYTWFKQRQQKAAPVFSDVALHMQSLLILGDQSTGSKWSCHSKLLSLSSFLLWFIWTWLKKTTICFPLNIKWTFSRDMVPMNTLWLFICILNTLTHFRTHQHYGSDLYL